MLDRQLSRQQSRWERMKAAGTCSSTTKSWGHARLIHAAGRAIPGEPHVHRREAFALLLTSAASTISASTSGPQPTQSRPSEQRTSNPTSTSGRQPYHGHNARARHPSNPAHNRQNKRQLLEGQPSRNVREEEERAVLLDRLYTLEQNLLHVAQQGLADIPQAELPLEHQHTVKQQAAGRQPRRLRGRDAKRVAPPQPRDVPVDEDAMDAAWEEKYGSLTELDANLTAEPETSMPTNVNSVVGSNSIIAAVTGSNVDSEVLAKAEVVTMNMTIVMLGQLRKLDEAGRLARWLLDNGLANSHTYASVFCAYAEAGRLDLMLDCWEGWARQQIDIGPIGASALIKAAATYHDIGLSLALFDRMLAFKVTMNRLTWNCLIHLCCEAGRMRDAMSVFSLMRNEPYEDSWPDTYTYGILMTGVVQHQCWAAVPGIWQAMQEDEVVPEAPVWCHLITAASHTRNTRQAQAFFDAMCERGVQPNLFVYNALMHAYASVGDFNRVRGLYGRLQHEQLPPDEFTFNCMLTAASRSRQPLREVSAIVSEMEAVGVQLNRFLGTALINAYRCCTAVTDAAAVKACVNSSLSILTSLRDRNEATAYTYTAMIKMAADFGNVQLMLRLLKDMELAGISPTSRTYQVLITGCQENGWTQAAEDFERKKEQLEHDDAHMDGVAGRPSGRLPTEQGDREGDWLR